ncbi:MAG: NAD(P)/FAD-dependent oxidoreductase [Ktedonobacteraceae bacterium]|jgi:NAD(P)H-nitrite reductase large subunit
MGSRTPHTIDSQYKAESSDIVIIGNGIAGLSAAVEARRLSPDAQIAVITDQCHPTIYTPSLKQFAIGKLTQEQLLAHPSGTERLQRIHMINARVEGINAQGKYLYLNGGYGFGYGSLLIATGSTPNSLASNLPGHDFDGVLTLHCLQDYLNLRRRLTEVKSAVVIGGGPHAIETVMCLLHYGIEVHWLIRSETFLSKLLDHAPSELILESVRQAGAKVYTDTKLIGIVGRVGSVAGVVTSQHNMLPCQLVLACTGTTPVTTLARQCTIPMLHDHGILVNDRSQTNVCDIYAAGDVAARKNPQTGSYEVHALWYNAVLQGRTAAAMMTGHHELASRSIGVPWHATHLGAFSMLSVGNHLHMMKGAKLLTDSTKKRYRRMLTLGDRLIGYLSLGPTQPDSLAIKRIIDEGLSIRGIEDALLKGDFDARKYFSRSRSRAVKDMVTSGKIPIVNPVQYTMPIFVGQTVTDGHTKSDTQSNASTGELPHFMHSKPGSTLKLEGPQTEPLHASAPRPLRVYDQPTIHEWKKEEECSTEKVPVDSSKAIQPFLMRLPSRPASHNLWSYSAKLPVVTGQQASSKHPGTSNAEVANHNEQASPTNFLL